MPAAAVIRRWQALSGIIGRKARVGGFKSDESPRLNRGGSLETGKLECRRGKWNSMCSANAQRYGGTPVAKATFWSVTDADVRKRGDQTGLDTLVVHAVNGDRVTGGAWLSSARVVRCWVRIATSATLKQLPSLSWAL